jgi:hypothetical protein
MIWKSMLKLIVLFSSILPIILFLHWWCKQWISGPDFKTWSQIGGAAQMCCYLCPTHLLPICVIFLSCDVTMTTSATVASQLEIRP